MAGNEGNSPLPTPYSPCPQKKLSHTYDHAFSSHPAECPNNITSSCLERVIAMKPPGDFKQHVVYTQLQNEFANQIFGALWGLKIGDYLGYSVKLMESKDMEVLPFLTEGRTKVGKGSVIFSFPFNSGGIQYFKVNIQSTGRNKSG